MFFRAHLKKSLKIFIPLNLNEKKKKNISTRSLFKSFRFQNERDSSHKVREESLTSFR